MGCSPPLSWYYRKDERFKELRDQGFSGPSSGRVVDLWTCQECGAIVLQGYISTHKQWHERPVRDYRLDTIG